MQNQEQANFYAIIPAPVLNDPELSAGAKLLFGTISQLLNERGYCYAANAYLMERNNASRRTIIRWIDELHRRGHIRTVIERKAARDQKPQRRIYSSYAGECQKRHTGECQKEHTGERQKRHTENTKIENTSFKNNPPQTPQGEPLPVYFSMIPQALKTGQFLAAWLAWENYHTEKRNQLTPLTAEKQLKKMEDMGELRAVAAIDNSIEKGYTGLFEPANQGFGAHPRPNNQKKDRPI